MTGLTGRPVREQAGLLAIILTLVAADWLSKLWIINRIRLGETLSLIDGWLIFVHRKNPGVAFSMLADLPDTWRVPLLTLASLIGVVLFGRIILSTPDTIVRTAAAIVLAGAIGNLGDRLVNGEVTDFVLVSFFPFVFNVADAAITVGGFLLAGRLLFSDAALEPVPVAESD
ncbi:MAG: signal peptidase II [Gemmatimonadetes bacterium]|nr:signal peptidase II [Gemmatimonadota bacterium]